MKRTALTLLATLALVSFADAQTLGVSPPSGGSGGGSDPAAPFTVGYVSGLWYNSAAGYVAANGTNAAAGAKVNCAPYVVSPPGFTAAAIGVSITTADTTPNFVSMAIYNNASGKPGTLLDSIGSTGLTTATAAMASATLANGTDALAAGAYWVCYATNSTTAVVFGTGPGGGTSVGSTTINSAIGVVTNAAVGFRCTGGSANCGPAWTDGSGSSYEWPSTLVGATWAQVTGGGQIPAIALQAD